jgi:hypothetical protein
MIPKRNYVLALLCHLSIPAVVIAGAGLCLVIDPEMARGHADYARNFHVLNLARLGVLWATAGVALLLWTACCYLVLKSRRRSLRWLWLAAAGPFGFSVIAALEDRSPAPGDVYQHVIRNLKTYWRVPFEIGVFMAIWFVAYESVVLKRELMIRFESLTTGTPTATIIAQQNASSGMWAAGEGLEELYLVPLLYLLWPVAFNVAGRFLAPQLTARRRRAADSTRTTRSAGA